MLTILNFYSIKTRKYFKQSMIQDGINLLNLILITFLILLAYDIKLDLLNTFKRHTYSSKNKLFSTKGTGKKPSIALNSDIYFKEIRKHNATALPSIDNIFHEN